MSAPPLLEARSLSKRFRGLQAVDDVSFAVPRGGIVALIGPNGAGKTTTFNLIAGVFAPDSGSPVYDAATGDLVVEVSSDGIDFGAALAYGRTAGGPALREMTFHERAELAKSVGQLLREHRDELYHLSFRTGATLADSRFDIDGGIGVLLSYASKAKRELPNDRVLVEGPPEQLGKSGQFLGQHLLTPLHGVAVQINAFNFPVWGPLEKLAPALIAGCTVIVKAAPEAPLDALLLAEMIDEARFPPGVVSILTGGPAAGDGCIPVP